MSSLAWAFEVMAVAFGCVLLETVSVKSRHRKHPSLVKLCCFLLFASCDAILLMLLSFIVCAHLSPSLPYLPLRIRRPKVSSCHSQ